MLPIMVDVSVPQPDPTDRTTDQLLREVSGAVRLIEARLGGIEKVVDREFALIEARRVEQKVDTKVAVDAALSAAEKAVKEQTVASEKSILKSETAAAEQSKQQNATFAAALQGVTGIVMDIKDRVVKIESRKEGSTDARTFMFGLGGLVLTLAIIISPHIK